MIPNLHPLEECLKAMNYLADMPPDQESPFPSLKVVDEQLLLDKKHFEKTQCMQCSVNKKVESRYYWCNIGFYE